MTVSLLVRRAHREMGRGDGWVGGGETNLGGVGGLLYTVVICRKGPGESAAEGHRLETEPSVPALLSHQPALGHQSALINGGLS